MVQADLIIMLQVWGALNNLLALTNHPVLRAGNGVYITYRVIFSNLSSTTQNLNKHQVIPTAARGIGITDAHQGVSEVPKI